MNEVLSDAASFSNMLDSLTEAVVAINSDGYIIVFNEMASEILDLPAEKALNVHIEEIIHDSYVYKVLKNEQPELNKIQIINGKRIIGNHKIFYDKKGKVAGAITTFRSMQQAMEFAQKASNFKDTQEIMKAVFYNSQDAFYVLDERNKIVLINQAFTRITNITEVLAKNCSINDGIINAEDIHRNVQRTRKVIKGVELNCRLTNGKIILNVIPLLINGEFKGSVGVVHDLSEIGRLKEEVSNVRKIINYTQSKYNLEDIIGSCKEIIEAKELALKVAQTPASVLLRGETGTGKELFAHAIHHASDRKKKPFVRVNCAAIPKNLLESEFFGFEEGSFTGAKKGGHKGFFEEANEGTLFLDEVGEIHLSLQAKLLRVLQEKEFSPIGSTKPRYIDIRIISATNANIEEMIENNTFREDLFYRLSVMPIYIPPLRERINDIPHLVNFFIAKISANYGKVVDGIENHAVNCLKIYSWPGNLRELENVLGRAIINMKQNERIINFYHLPMLKDKGHQTITLNNSEYINGTLEELQSNSEKNIIARALVAFNGNKTETARSLNISIRNLYYKIEKYNLQ